MRAHNISGTKNCYPRVSLSYGELNMTKTHYKAYPKFESPLYSRAALNQDHRGPASQGSAIVRIKGGVIMPKSEVIMNFKDIFSPFGAYGQMKIYRED
ncbi:hypothetical protein VN97_g12960 [Penicillium thymicola]|uniref:Uncharacterized protein n=1 Tax=Penicillium thymicola TaxID=293382 RepID=A0AAI9T5G1_PENTH|nr:hypothetical protein VN97_g12960 [Penicillium thymicola]